MISTTPKTAQFDIIIISGEYYDDHPLSPVGIIARVLDAQGYSVGIIEKPESEADFKRLGSPKLFFGVTSGSIDSQLYNYTPLKRKRSDDPTQFITEIPERAVIFYCNKLRQYFKNCTLVIGGVEASLRRFAHYDYWDNKIRKSILLDSRANILVYGNGEKQIIQIAERIKEYLSEDKKTENKSKQGEPENKDKLDLRGIEGTCILSKELDKELKIELLPSFNEIKEDDFKSKKKFCEMQVKFSNTKNLAQGYDNNYVIQYRSPIYTSEDLDQIYSLPFTRKLHPESLLGLAKFSVVTHRGCIGKCNFCSITLHQGDKIISRSEKSILSEIEQLTKHPEFKGFIHDLGGPAANMYGMDCVVKCNQDCISCQKLDKSHSKLIELLRKARQIPGIKKIFIHSGIRYDLALESHEYIKEISEHHISGCLKIAPEHFSPNVLKLMGKSNDRFEEFYSLFMKMNKDKRQDLRYYFMIGHPGDDEKEVRMLVSKLRKLNNIEQFQLFTPTPMTNSTCMYWTGMDPFTLKSVKVVYDFVGKKKLRDMMLDVVEKER